MPRPRKSDSPFRYFNSSPDVIRLAVMMCVRFPLSLRNVEDLLFERGIDISYEIVRYCLQLSESQKSAIFHLVRLRICAVERKQAQRLGGFVRADRQDLESQ